MLSCGQGLYELDQTEMGFGSYIRIRAGGRDSAAVNQAVRQAFAELHRLDTLWSSFLEKSEVARLNRAGRMVVTAETKDLLVRAQEIAVKTDGAFDITVAPLLRLWGFYDGNYRVPERAAVESLLAVVDYQKVQVKGDTVILGKGVNIDLGGVAVGWAVDRAVAILKEMGMVAGLVDAGGDIRVFGKRCWRIGVQHPRSEGVMRILELQEEAVATSGDYERFFVANGRRFCHIINPQTGYPADGVVAVTVVAPTALEADAYSTAVFVMGEKGREWLERQGLVGVLFFVQGDSLVMQETGRTK